MATNAELNTLISTINDGGLNTALEIRNVLHGIKDEMFSNIHSQYVPPTEAFNYLLNFRKIGTLCHIEGYIYNSVNYFISSIYARITINNQLFLPANSVYNLPIINNSIDALYLQINPSGVMEIRKAVLGGNQDYNLPPSSFFNINGFYVINP